MVAAAAWPRAGECSGHFLIKKVTTAGAFKVHHTHVHLANALVDQHIGLDETDDGSVSVSRNINA